MGHGTILRVRDNLSLTPALSSSLSELLGEYSIERYTQQRNLSDIYKKRVDSLVSAFHFILKAYPPNTGSSTDALGQYVEQCRKNFDPRHNTIQDLQKSLTLFTAQLVNALIDSWEWTHGKERKEAIACLNEAEQYVLMQQGAESIATLVPMTLNNQKLYTVQFDKRLSSHTDDRWLKELEQIKKEKAPFTPSLFRGLKAHQQAYFCHLNETGKTLQGLQKEWFDFYIKWINLSEQPFFLARDLKRISQHTHPFPDWFNKLNPSQQEMLRILATQSIENINSEFMNFNLFMTANMTSDMFTDLSLIPNLPQWYWLLSATQQRFLGHTLEHSSDLKEATSFLPSRLRTLPALANFRSHRMISLDSEGKVLNPGAPRYASSHIVSRDVLEQPESVQQRHYEANLNTVLSLKSQPSQSTLIQTLISPAGILNYIPAYFSVPPDASLDEQLKKAIVSHNTEGIIYYKNHPQNIAKRLYYTTADDPSCLALLNATKQQLVQKSEHWQLSFQYEQALKSGCGSATYADHSGRELFLSSYEHLLILSVGGLSYGSCVSGKDRKSIELIHTDAMLLYFSCYHCWPELDDTNENRQRFIQIVVELYVSFHAQYLAGQNAPGSEGLKTPENYWPADIAEAIKARLGENSLNEDDRMATNNEVARISKDLKEYIKPGKALCAVAALTIGSQNCQKLIDVLCILINEKNRFKPETNVSFIPFFSPNEPRGVTNIRHMIRDHLSANPDDKNTALDIVTNIFYTIQKRPDRAGNRSNTTIEVYRLLRELIYNPAEIQDVLNGLNEIKGNSFKLNQSICISSI